MTPSSSGFYSTNCGFTNTEHFGYIKQALARCYKLFNLYYIGITELCRSIFLSIAADFEISFFLVSSVLLICAPLEVFDVIIAWVVIYMINLWVAMFIFYKCERNKSMNKKISIFPIIKLKLNSSSSSIVIVKFFKTLSIYRFDSTARANLVTRCKTNSFPFFHRSINISQKINSKGIV